MDFLRDWDGTLDGESPQAALYEAWYEHRFADDRFSVLVGLHDLNSDRRGESNGNSVITHGIPPTQPFPARQVSCAWKISSRDAANNGSRRLRNIASLRHGCVN